MLTVLSAAQINTMVHTFNWHSPSWDLFILLFWAVASIIYAFTAGRGRIINILMSIYIAKLLVIEMPFLTAEVTKHLSSSLVSIQQLITFVLLFLLLFLFLGRFAFRTSADGRQVGAVIFGIFFSVLQIGLLINTILFYLPAATLHSFTPLIQILFIKDPASFIWLIAPLAYLVVLGKHVADPNEL